MQMISKRYSKQLYPDLVITQYKIHVNQFKQHPSSLR